MSKLVIEIKTNNAAFEGDDLQYELGNILAELGEHIVIDGVPRHKAIMDTNGNTVGSVTYHFGLD